MLFVALGDSITYGLGASRPSLAYPRVLARLLQHSRRTGSRVCAQVLAEPGWTSGALASAVVGNGAPLFSGSGAIVIWVGGDNLAYAGLAALENRSNALRTIEAGIRQYGVELARLVQYIKMNTRAPILVCTQYNPFPNSPIAEQGIGALNQATATVAGRLGVQLVPSAAWFAGRQSELIAHYRTGTLADVRRPPLPIHPNDRGHRVIAEGLYSVMAPISG